MDKIAYVAEMYSRDRLVVFCDKNNSPRAILTFFITNNIRNFIRKDIWSAPEEDINGLYIYIDKLISDRKSAVSPNIANLVNYFDNRFPNKKVVWHSRRRLKNEYQLHA